MKNLCYIFLTCFLIIGCKNNKENHVENVIIDPPLEDLDGGDAGSEEGFFIYPISHASFIIHWEKSIIYIDPVGARKLYTSYNPPNLILITDIHADHFDTGTIEAIVTDQTQLIAPQAVFDKLPQDLKSKAQVLNNDEKTKFSDIAIQAIPMYNLREDALTFHPKGRGNGYVLESNDKRIYISGDTEDIPEMRNLKDIDIAFVCMNLPYTMTVEQAADAVLDFKPKTVYPYHYRGENGLSDVGKFKSLIEAKSSDIKVTQLDWYSSHQ